MEGANERKLFGQYYPIKAKIVHLESLSAHADQGELLDWMREIKKVPEKVFLIMASHPPWMHLASKQKTPLAGASKSLTFMG